MKNEGCTDVKATRWKPVGMGRIPGYLDQPLQRIACEPCLKHPVLSIWGHDPHPDSNSIQNYYEESQSTPIHSLLLAPHGTRWESPMGDSQPDLRHRWRKSWHLPRRCQNGWLVEIGVSEVMGVPPKSSNLYHWNPWFRGPECMHIIHLYISLSIYVRARNMDYHWFIQRIFFKGPVKRKQMMQTLHTYRNIFCKPRQELGVFGSNMW